MAKNKKNAKEVKSNTAASFDKSRGYRKFFTSNKKKYDYRSK